MLKKMDDFAKTKTSLQKTRQTERKKRKRRRAIRGKRRNGSIKMCCAVLLTVRANACH